MHAQTHTHSPYKTIWRPEIIINKFKSIDEQSDSLMELILTHFNYCTARNISAFFFVLNTPVQPIKVTCEARAAH